MSQAKFGSGDWFAVPLQDDGYALGVIARKKTVLFGYFFGPRRAEVPTLKDVASLRPADAVLAGRFGYLGLKDGTWPVLGRRDDWDPSEWPMPPLVRHEELTGKTILVTYDDKDPGRRVREEVVESGAATGPREDLMGHVYVQLFLTRELGSASTA